MIDQLSEFLRRSQFNRERYFSLEELSNRFSPAVFIEINPQVIACFERLPGEAKRSTKSREANLAVRAISCDFGDRSCPGRRIHETRIDSANTQNKPLDRMSYSDMMSASNEFQKSPWHLNPGQLEKKPRLC